jgi:hypothetical protein
MLFIVNLFATNRALYIKKYKNENKVALVIGNCNYSSFTKLKNSCNDANDIGYNLQNLGFKVYFLKNGSKKEMKQKIKTFTNALKNGGVGMFYYAGHGIEVDNKNYLIPLNADISEKPDVEDEAVSVNWIISRMEYANNRLNIVVLDACRNNPFGRGGGGGLAPINDAKGMYIAFATAPGKTASDGNGRNGLFTKYLIKNLQTPNLTLNEVFDKTRQEVYYSSDERQTPWTSSSVIGEFYFKLDGEVSHPSTFSFKNIDDKVSLTINPTPYNARVEITNISKSYYDGIKLKKGRYNIRVSKDGYITKSGYIDLKSDTNIAITLDKEPIATTSYISHKTTATTIYTWIDPDTGLMWQNEKYTAEDDRNYKKNIEGGKVWNWWNAKEYCQNLQLDGYSDWRLPTRDELKTIISNTNHNGYYIKKELSKSMGKGSYFWSSTPYVSFSERAWYVNFSNGYGSSNYKYYKNYVRCVRDSR